MWGLLQSCDFIKIMKNYVFDFAAKFVSWKTKMHIIWPQNFINIMNLDVTWKESFWKIDISVKLTKFIIKIT